MSSSDNRVGRRSPPAVALFLAAAALAAAWGGAAGAAEFDGARAMSWLERQCALGPRIPGSPGHAALETAILEHARSLGLTAHRLPFERPHPYARETLRLTNLVILAGRGSGPRLWIGAHYDSRPTCDRDPDPARAARPLTGANDGASGTAVLLHLAELMAAEPPPRPVALIFFDGEDLGRAGDLDGYCLGSRRLAEHWNDFGAPLAGPPPRGLILLDMVGDRDLAIPQEGYGLALAGEWTRTVFARAEALGLSTFVPEPGPAVFDDHVPFLHRGLPAVDLIDFDYPAWHTAADVPAACSAASLEQAGTLVWDLIRHPPD